mmetsp:Transcript_93583/g.146095  ORF Transcript_93583/g.146095 Transcript_93583/m.146095 type:complete len:210 (-) Transcript_93583:109-738(-)
MDFDAWIMPNTWSEYFWQEFTGTQSDIVAAAPSYVIFINSAVLMLQNTTFTRKVVTEWLKNRCINDQLSLYVTFYQEWHTLDNTFKWDRDKIVSYIPPSMAKDEHDMVPTYFISKLEHFHPEGVGTYVDTKVLNSTLHFPHLELLQNVGEQGLRCRRQDATHHRGTPLICHKKYWQAVGRTNCVNHLDKCGCAGAYKCCNSFHTLESTC